MGNQGLLNKRIAIIGGCGHVGLPLGVKLALAGAKTSLIDIDEEKIAAIGSGRFPFIEKGGDAELSRALESGLSAGSDPSACAKADVIVFVTGTPVDEHLNPKLSEVLKIFSAYKEYFSPGVLIIMRSTLFPGTMGHLHELVKSSGLDIKLAFCPERVAQGYALDEIDSLPQIVSAFDDESFEAAYEVFSALAPEIIRIKPLEAELAKLMANSWRYLEFAISNQFYMIAESNGVDFSQVFQAVRHNYPRASGYKTPGFAAGPCLFKDTMQLASYFDDKFYMGHAAMLVNEGLATYVVNKAVDTLGGSLWGKTVGLLGMTFKPENDDVRESLSFKVKKGLAFKGAEVIFSDPYVRGSLPTAELLEKADLVVLTTPHKEFCGLDLKIPIIDVWGIYDRSELEVFPGRKSQ